jgi:hypothetical protein
MLRKKLNLYVLILIIIYGLVLIIYSATTSYYIGSFTSSTSIYLPPKYEYRLLTYDLLSGNSSITIIRGIPLELSIIASRNNIILFVYGFGTDFYVVFISILSVVAWIIECLIGKTGFKEIILVLLLILASLTILYPYMIYNSKPIMDAKIIDIEKPVEVFPKENIGVLDIIEPGSTAIFYISSNNTQFGLALMDPVTKKYSILVYSTRKYTGVLNVDHKKLLLIIPLNNKSIDSINMIYRRAEIFSVDSNTALARSITTILPTILLSTALIIEIYSIRKK